MGTGERRRCSEERKQVLAHVSIRCWFTDQKQQGATAGVEGSAVVFVFGKKSPLPAPGRAPDGALERQVDQVFGLIIVQEKNNSLPLAGVVAVGTERKDMLQTYDGAAPSKLGPVGSGGG